MTKISPKSMKIKMGKIVKEEDDIYEIYPGDENPKKALKDGITKWAREKLVGENGAPAPLYIVLLNHGNENTFHLNGNFLDEEDNVVTSSELNSWIADLEESIAENELASKEKIIIVLGMCFSGSFIPGLKERKGRE